MAINTFYAAPAAPPGEMGLLDLAVPLAQSRRLLIGGPVAAAIAILALTFLVPPTYSAHTTFIPPQQQQSSAAAALSSLGALSGLAGVAAGVKNSSDQYASLLQSDTVTDRMIDAFSLLKVYDVKYRVDAHRQLAKSTHIVADKKDGLITIEVEDEDPQRVAKMADRYVDELRRLSSQLALSEAQERRIFFEAHLKKSRDDLATAQKALQGSGVSDETLKAEPRSATEAYARLKAEAVAGEVRLQALRNSLADSAPEVQAQLATLKALREQLAKSESNGQVDASQDYVSKYREFKYQETLFELFSRQYELARLDESREGGLIQVVDAAQVPERKTRPKRLLLTLAGGVVTFAALFAFVLLRHNWRESMRTPENAEKLARLRNSFQKQ